MEVVSEEEGGGGVCSVVPPKRTENTFSLGVASVAESRQISCPSVPSQMHLWIGMLLKLGV
jgi:hypothetical protein